MLSKNGDHLVCNFLHTISLLNIGTTGYASGLRISQNIHKGEQEEVNHYGYSHPIQLPSFKRKKAYLKQIESS